MTPAPEDLQKLVGFLSNDEWDELLAQVNGNIQRMEALPDGELKAKVFELLQGVDAIHREALRRLVRLFKTGVLEQVVSDPAIHTLMELYDLLPPTTPEPTRGAHQHRFPTIPIKAASAANAGRPRYPHWVPVLPSEDALAPGMVDEYLVDGSPVLLANHSGQFFALASQCAQDGASLRGASLNGYTLACPNHSGCYYDVRQGTRMGHSARIACFPVKQETDGRVLVGIDMDFTPSLPSF